MNGKDKKQHLASSPKAWCLSMLIGAVVMGLVALYRFSSSYAGEEKRLLYSLCDGAFVAAVLLAGVGLLVWIGSAGTFDTLTYAAHSLKRQLLPFGSREEKRRDYYQYKLDKEEKRRPVPVFLLGSGGFFLFLAAVLLLVNG